MSDLPPLPALPARTPVDKHIPTGIVTYGHTDDAIRAYAEAYARAAVAAERAKIEQRLSAMDCAHGCKVGAELAAAIRREPT